MEPKDSLPYLHFPIIWPYPKPDLSQQCPLPHSTSWRTILILSSHLCLGLPYGLFHAGFSTKPLYVPLLSPMHPTCPAHFILLNLITKIVLGEECKPLNTSLFSFLHSPVTSSLLGPNILFSTQFWNTFSLRSSLSLSDHVSHPYFWIAHWKTKDSAPNDSKHWLISVCSSFF